MDPHMYPNYKEIHLLYVNNYRFDIYVFKNNHLQKLLFETIVDKGVDLFSEKK